MTEAAGLIEVAELPNDLETLASRWASEPGFVWLDGAPGSWSYLALDPVEEVSATANGSGLRDALARLSAEEGVHCEAPLRVPRWLGYVSYDALWKLMPAVHEGRTRAPEERVLWFGRYDAVLAVDHASGRAWFCGESKAAVRRLAARVREAVTSSVKESGVTAEVAARVGDAVGAAAEQHQQAITRAQEEIAAGTFYLINLARKWRAPLMGSPWLLWKAMRAESPVPFGAYIFDGVRYVLSRSMEQFVDWNAHHSSITTRPIKGTVTRSQSMDDDARSLARDAKEQAEHTMVIDLLRNDLCRVAKSGTVRVIDDSVIEHYAGLSHMVSTIRCMAKEGLTFSDLLKAAFPPGSVTGMPKREVVHWIEALEASPRGVYTGAIGFVDSRGGCLLSVAIRTAVVAGGQVTYFAGGGITARSRAEKELAETELKAAVFLKALERVPCG